MPADVDGGTATHGAEGANLPGALAPYVGTMARSRRRHDRSKYPWRYQRFRRKLIQITVVSSIALLFLCGVLYMMIAGSHSPSSDSSTNAPARIVYGA
jgi:hypothetical protein